MNRLTKIALGATALAVLATPALAQTSNTATANGTTTIVQPIMLTKTADLAFGKVAKPRTGSNTVVINETTGVRSMSGGGDGALVTGGTVARAGYSVSGDASTAYSITLPAATFQMTKAGGTTPLTVTLVRSATTGTLSAGGTDTFGVGGSFTVAAATETGAYTGTFDVTVNYN